MPRPNFDFSNPARLHTSINAYQEWINTPAVRPGIKPILQLIIDYLKTTDISTLSKWLGTRTDVSRFETCERIFSNTHLSDLHFVKFVKDELSLIEGNSSLRDNPMPTIKYLLKDLMTPYVVQINSAVIGIAGLGISSAIAGVGQSTVCTIFAAAAILYLGNEWFTEQRIGYALRKRLYADQARALNRPIEPTPLGDDLDDPLQVLVNYSQSGMRRLMLLAAPAHNANRVQIVEDAPPPAYSQR